MLRSQRDYEKALRAMLLRVQRADSLDDVQPHQMNLEDAEILMDCVKLGYLHGRAENKGAELRTMDGKAHPVLLNTIITPKGLAFLRPKHTDIKATAAIVISILALLVSILSDLDRIIENCRLILNLAG
ncbi:hypothetical protein [Clostridium sp. J1101437_171009_A5]|uniref:hypothetical protein n=1 Tax=Clostridium sp. J1101437_171009_A5 TaxID=2787098 RepID=UPI001897C919|nr:hypothetical protein [Clostridium sp. J1101437_171009_A5]